MEDRWEAITKEILAALDIAAEFRDLGLDIVGSTASEKGWIACRAFGRKDSDPSAGINVGANGSRGRYKDHTTGENLSLFDFAVKAGKFTDWRQARKFYAERANIKVPTGAPKKRPDDKISFLTWIEAKGRIWTAKKKGISIEAVKMAGGRLGRWPANAGSDSIQNVIAFPIFGPGLTEQDPVGWVIVNMTGENLVLYQGPNRPPLVEKVLVVGGSNVGLLNEYALQRIRKAELILKVEGLTDVLATQTAIPIDLRDKHVVITNSNGTNQNVLAWWADLLAGKDVITCHDSDKPGQQGAMKWVQALGQKPRSLRNLVLPYPIEEKHGKDLRDFFAEGKTYHDLLALAEKAHPLRAAEVEKAIKSEDDDLLEKLDLTVLGLLPNDAIVLYNAASKRNHTIDKLDYLGYGRLSMICGAKAKAVMPHYPKGELPAGIITTLPDLKSAIGRKSFEVGMNLQTNEWFGKGCWWDDQEQKIVLVDSNCGYVWNGESFSTLESPRLGRKIYDFSQPDRWIDLAMLKRNIAEMDGQASGDYLDELQEVLSRWRWERPEDSLLTAALMLSSWIQTLWDWRPHVSLVGPTNTGKTVFIESFMRQFFGPLGLMINKASAAGVLQRLGHSALVTCLDELEHDRERPKIQEYLRTSNRGGTIMKGTADQRGRSYTLRHIFWTAAIESGLVREPDKNRYIVLGTTFHHGANNLELPPAGEIQSLGSRGFAVMLKHAIRAVQLHRFLKAQVVPGVPPRHVESFAVPAAVVSAIRSLSDQDSVAILQTLVSDRFTEVAHPHDEEELVQDVLSSQIFVGGGKSMTVAEIISNKFNFDAQKNDLERNGVTLTTSTRGPKQYHLCDKIFMAPKEILRFLFKFNTRWQAGMDLQTIMLRIRGARAAQVSLLGNRVWGVEMPLKSIHDFVNDPEEEASDEQEDIEP